MATKTTQSNMEKLNFDSTKKNHSPKLGDLVVVRITNIENKNMTMSCELVEYDGWTGIVARVDGRRKTHHAYRQLKVGHITILSCNLINETNQTVELSYSAIDSNQLSAMKEHYKKLEKIKLTMLKIAALKAKKDPTNILELKKNTVLMEKAKQLYAEIFHKDIVAEFFDRTYDMYERCKNWSFYDEETDLLLKHEYSLPHYIAYIDIGLLSYHCDAKKHIKEVLNTVKTLIDKEVANYTTRLVDNYELLAGPVFRFTIHDQRITNEEILDLQTKILLLNTDHLNVSIKPVQIDRKK